MNYGVEKDDDKGIHKGDNHPDVHHLDVGGLGHAIEHGDEEWGEGHEHCCVDGDDTLKHFKSDEVVGQLKKQIFVLKIFLNVEKMGLIINTKKILKK